MRLPPPENTLGREPGGHCAATLAACLAWAGAVAFARFTEGAKVQKRYYAHPAVHDRYGVIAPWYTAQNGQLDFRIRVAAETLKRYPWTDPRTAAAAVPHYVFNGHWKITPEGTITPVPINDWDNGDLGQRAAYVLSGLVDYYRYSGDAAAVALIHLQAQALLEYCLTPPDHPWPNFLVSVPVKGKPYAKCDPGGMIQLDIVAEVGIGLLKAYQLIGRDRWLDACKHWGDLLASNSSKTPGQSPWGRYANPETVPWKNTKQTGGVAFLLCFLDELIRLGYTGKQSAIVQARDAGRAYLRDVLLPAWTVNDTWGRNYWDWEDPVQAENVTEFVCRYMMDNKEDFPNWRNDVRNILTLFFHRTGVCPKSAGEVYSGAWAFPESAGCCGRSLWYGPMELAVPLAQYAAETGSPWAREVARRMQILATYDGHETGVSEDNIDGGFVVNADWFKIAHPMALKHLLGTIAWMPEEFAPARENHIVRSTAVVSNVRYQPDMIDYATFDAPAGTVDVLRLSFEPGLVRASDQPLPLRQDLQQNGYTVKPLAGGDFLVMVRHDGLRRVLIGPKSQADLGSSALAAPASQSQAGAIRLAGTWSATGEDACIAQQAGDSAELTFLGNQVRVLGGVAPDGGLAEVYLDGAKQLVGIDCWNPSPRQGQTLYYRNGLADGEHTIKIVVQGTHNPHSTGTKVRLTGLTWSAAKAAPESEEGRGPTDVQRWVFGYPGREDLKDSAGNLWRPATEWVVRTGTMTDSVAAAWWTTPCPEQITGTKDPELYRYGVHAKEFVANVTVGPGKYYVKLCFAATRGLDTSRNRVSVEICGKRVVTAMDVAQKAGGPNKALDLVYSDITPRNGVIDIRFLGGEPDQPGSGEAFVQAVEVGPAAEAGLTRQRSERVRS
ncbi:MAG: malectin domain-containing carbohydrate-binding protein [Thermoguttaceae bacterium]